MKNEKKNARAAALLVPSVREAGISGHIRYIEAKYTATLARLDAERTAKPLTRLLGHAEFGMCVGPGTVNADTLETIATGERTLLA